jgi:hypothetical protein
MPLPDDLAKVQLWPIQAKGAVIRHSPLGDPDFEKYYHKTMVDGAWMERGIADANHWLLQKKVYWQHRIAHALDINQVAVDGQLRYNPRKIKYVADSIKFLKEVNQFQLEIQQLINAVTHNIQMLEVMVTSMTDMVQRNLNSLATLLNSICTWGLPQLPSLPNLLRDGLFNWNGFNFSSLLQFSQLHPNLTFSPNFSFKQCKFQLPAFGNPSASPSPSVESYSGNTFGTVGFVPPLDGSVPPGGQDLSDTAYRAQMQATTSAVYGPAFNPNSMLGAVPDPSTIISNYQMPPQTYQANIVSIVPALRGNTVEPGDADYGSPNLAVRQPSLQKALVHFINLDAVVSSNYDPHITSAWIFYLNATRNGRDGRWLGQFQDVFAAYIAPSAAALANAPVPWNNVLGGAGVSDTPTDIPLIDGFNSLAPLALNTLLWKLSYIEASLLGYTRSKTWDAHQDGMYLTGVTGSDLDYVPTLLTAANSTVTLGRGTAAFPVLCTFPTAMAATLNQVVAQATLDILNDPAYESPRLSNRFVYDQFAEATLVDRFTQFWRDFNTNVAALLAQDAYTVQFAASYFAVLNGALNPLGDKSAYAALQSDTSTRSRAWTPGTPTLAVPVAPIVTYTNNSDPTASGWQGIQFDTQAFLARPDIQGQPIPVQNAMLRTNLSYAGLLQYRQTVQDSLQEQIDNANALIQSSQVGFSVTDDAAVTTVSSGSAAVPVAFDTVIFDLTGNVTSETAYTVRATGEYAYYGSVRWLGTDTGGIRTVTVTQNNAAIYTQSSDADFTAPLDVQFSGYGNFAAGDVVQVLASHSFPGAETVGAGSFFGMTQSGPTDIPPQLPAAASSNTKEFTAAASMPSAPTAFFFQPGGGIAPVDPTVVRGHINAAITSVLVSGSILTVTVNTMPVPFSMGSTVFFWGVGTAKFLNGMSVVVLTSSATQFTASMDFSTYPVLSPPVSPPVPVADTGTASGGTVLFPFVDGITTAGVAYPASPPVSPPVPIVVECGTTYGGVYQIAGANFTVGALLYVGPGGVLTQNYAALINPLSPPLSPPLEVQWVICAGRAIGADTIIFEPTLPFRIVFQS